MWYFTFKNSKTHFYKTKCKLYASELFNTMYVVQYYVCSTQTGKHTDISKVKIQAKPYFQPQYDFPEDNGK